MSALCLALQLAKPRGSSGKEGNTSSKLLRAESGNIFLCKSKLRRSQCFLSPGLRSDSHPPLLRFHLRTSQNDSERESLIGLSLSSTLPISPAYPRRTVVLHRFVLLSVARSPHPGLSPRHCICCWEVFAGDCTETQFSLWSTNPIPPYIPSVDSSWLSLSLRPIHTHT